MSIFWSRVFLVVVAIPIFIPIAFLWTLVKETKNAFVYAWQDVRMCWADVRYNWNHGIRKTEEKDDDGDQ